MSKPTAAQLRLLRQLVPETGWPRPYVLFRADDWAVMVRDGKLARSVNRRTLETCERAGWMRRAQMPAGPQLSVLTEAGRAVLGLPAEEE